MNKSDIEKLEAGDELDALVATEVMEWHKQEDTYHNIRWMDKDNRNSHSIAPVNGEYSNGSFEDDEDFNLINWHPSGSILWAEEVIQKMEEKDFWFSLSNVIPNSDPIVYEVKFERAGKIGYACEGSIACAISKAALLAVMEFENDAKE